jgi:hypothetical protein
MKTQLLIRPQRREFSVANNRAVLDWIILVTLGAPGSLDLTMYCPYIGTIPLARGRLLYSNMKTLSLPIHLVTPYPTVQCNSYIRQL